MILAAGQHWVAPQSAPTALICCVAAILAVAWVMLHRVGRSPWVRRARWVLAAVRLSVAAACLFAVSQALQRYLIFATDWPVWSLAIGGALAVELAAWLYALELAITPRRLGTCMFACRAVLLLAVVGMLAQPVRSLDMSRSYDRTVAILIDDSASMHIADEQLGSGQKMRLAAAVSRGALSRPFRFEVSARRLEGLRREMAAHAAALSVMKDSSVEVRGRYLAGRREAMRGAIDKWRQTMGEEMTIMARPLDGVLTLDERTGRKLTELRGKLSAGVMESLSKASESIASGKAPATLGRNYGRLLAAYRRASSVLKEAIADIWRIGDTLDALAYGALAPDRRREVDATARRPRYALARDVLTADADSSLLKLCGEKYGVRLYSFSGDVSELDVERWALADRPVLTIGADEDGKLSAKRRNTDLAGALRKVASDIPAEQLAGIILLTDGRHNASRAIDPIARQLAMTGVPVSSVVFGGMTGPLDAAIVSAQAPETIYLKDRTYITVRLKFDGLAGKKIKVTLSEGDRVADTREVMVASKSYRTDIQLADEPKTTGPHSYRITVDHQAGEVLSNNNEYPLTVHVTDDRTKMLIIEGRARWEFRYLRNLFAGRDRTVKLQYVLLQPDLIEGVAPKAIVPASASRALNEIEATALPANESEWMKFDVVVLGDVAPALLGPRQLDALWRFVTDRGGTLIVIAGQAHMPHDYAGSGLQDVLPVVFAPAGSAATAPPDAFRIALTGEGDNSIVMRQVVDKDENRRIWRSMPPIHWRNTDVTAKPGATVLAYALDAKTPPYVRKAPAAGGSDAARLQRLAEKYRRTHPLIVSHNVALGRVMFLAFDRTWRMRYRIGDTRHHKFWGQVLRWATAGRLAAGTTLVKMGVDRSHYPAHQHVRVFAKIVKRDFTPVVSREVAVNVFDDSSLVLRKKLTYAPDSPGMYTGDLGTLPSGAYRVELDAPAAVSLLALENTSTVQTFFSVDPTTPVELIELSAERALLSSLAGATGGAVVGPEQADELIALLGPSVLTRADRWEYSFWDSWPLLVTMVIMATAEWLLRKKAGLA